MKSIKEYVVEFSTHIGNAIESINNAAIVYATALREHKDAAQAEFENAYPQVTPNTWQKFLAVGNGDLNPSALFLSDKFCAKIARMPKEKQDEVLNGDSFMIFNPTTREVDKVRYGQMKPRHERIVFDETKQKIRTIQEQIAYADLLAAEKKSAQKRYTVHTDFVDVHCACRIGKNEIEMIREEMQ